MKKFLFAVAVGVFSLAGLFADETMVLNMPLDDNSGLTDNSQCKNIAAFKGDAKVTDNALQLNGQKSCVVIKDGKNIAMGTGSLSGVISFKLSKDIKASVALITSGALSRKGDSGYSFIYDPKGKKLLFFISDGSQRLVFYTSNNDLADEKWHTAAFSYNKKAAKLILALDGNVLVEKAAGKMTQDMNDGSKKVKFGAWGRGYYLTGSIKNIKMYKAARSSEQLAADTKQ